MSSPAPEFRPDFSEFRPWAVKTRRWRIGDVTLTRIVERGGAPGPGGFLFSDATPEFVQQHPWLVPDFATPDGRIFAAIQAFVIESRGRRIVVDTCVGNDKPRHVPFFNMLQTPFLEDLAAAGFAPETVDTVLCTHLHVDHVGWNTKLVDGRWEPTFPRARYLIGRREWEYWSAEGVTNVDGDVVGDSVRPVVEAGLVDLVEMDHAITDEVRLIPTPGHTPGHVGVMIESGGLSAVITGDLMHHPIQCSAPALACNFDYDKDQTRATRRAFLAAFADRPTAVFGTHFADPTAGWIRAAGEDDWRFDATHGGDGAPADLRLSPEGDRWTEAG